MTIMSYNVENLFDYSDDPNTTDEQFLPKGHKSKKQCRKNKSSYRKNQCLRFNWDEKQFKKKLKRLAKVINSSNKKIDILALIEVENKFVVEQLNDQLKHPFDKIVVAATSDKRGVRTAFLIRTSKDLIWKSDREWKVKLKRRTRTILEAKVTWKKKDYCFFANHWPSQGSKTRARITAAETLVDALANPKNKDKKECTVVATGDFNTLDHEVPSPFSYLREAGLVDLTAKMRKSKKTLGTYFYGPRLAWNYLDRFFVSKSLAKSIRKKDISILVSKDNSGVWEQKKEKSNYYGTRVVGTPKRFKSGGVSDHFPIVLTIP